jgi:Ca2+-binding RTX toxin-like protein
LLYDADGVGGVAAVQFATLTGVTGLINNTEFLII